MEFIIKTTFNTSAKMLYDAWLSSKKYSEMTGGEAFNSTEIGFKFTAWDGYITGKNIILKLNKSIVQSWRTSEFEAHEPDSQIEIRLEEKDGKTEFTLTHSNLPKSGEHYRQGWETHYFEPMRTYFSELN